jgi:hypothetical protein
LNGTAEIIEMCPCDRIAYMDCTSTTLAHYKHAHRTRCPVIRCGLTRLVDVKTPHDVRSLPRKVMYYMPLRYFLQDVFRGTSMPSDLRHDTDGRPPGS